jgi:DNA-directed RNA polymerase specialized sigma24 family protein
MLAHEAPPIRPEDLLAHAGWLRQLALGLVRGAADPEDLVQATYLAALRSPPEPDLPVRRWLAQVLRNVWKMRVR